MSTSLGKFSRTAQLAFMSFALTLGGCAMQDQHVATTTKPTAWLVAVAPVWVYSIDGTKVSQIGFTGEKRFAISVGTHELRVRYSDRESRRVIYDNQIYDAEYKAMGYGVLPVDFQAEAGHVYYVHAGLNGNAWSPHVNEERDPSFKEIYTRQH